MRRHENGNILFYILIGVLLMGALTYVSTRSSGDTAAGTTAARLSEDIKSQAQLIRSALSECLLVNSYGYPLEPAAPGLVKDIECQIGDSPDVFQPVFTGTSNRFLPQPPAPFTDGWIYDVDSGTNPPTISILLTKAMNCSASQGV